MTSAQLDDLTCGLVEEMRSLIRYSSTSMCPPLPRSRSRHAKQAWLTTKRGVTERFAAAAGLDVCVAELELDTIRSQLVTLLTVTTREAHAAGMASRAPRPLEDSNHVVAFKEAVGALTAFYFRHATDDHNLLAETQLAWTATRRRRLARKSSRDARARASRRYMELWQIWIRNNGHPPGGTV